MAFPKPDPNLKPLTVGTVAPLFSAPASPNGQTASLQALRGQWVVLVFYPRDNTPGCTKQLCALGDDYGAFTALNAVVLGVNFGSLTSHQRFAERHNYPFPIVVDEERAIAKAYSCIKEDGGIARTVYVVNPEGVIAFAQQGMAKHEAMKAVMV